VANQLIGLTAPEVGADQQSEGKVMSEPRSYLYSTDCPEGRIFTGADAIAAAMKDGWSDSPANLKAKVGGKKKATDDDSK
jgi:hypothetical protein